MCTLSWLSRSQGYTVFFNRDERLTRAPALAPAVRDCRGVPFIAPLDGNFGGTWIAANAYGLALCVLNRYGEGAPPPADPISRGRLITSLIDCISGDEFRARLSALQFDRYQSFTLACLEPEHDVLIAQWDGRAPSIVEWARVGLVLTSSACDQPTVERARRATFEALGPAALTSEALAGIHASHRPERGARSVCMHREDAETQSFSRVTVTAQEVEFFHVPDAPCRGTPLPVVTIERAENCVSSER